MFDPRKIWASSQLPTLPSVAVKLLELSRDPESEIKSVIDAIKSDPAISAKVLKAANSTLFGLSSKVTSVDRAVPLLGTTVVTSLALSFSLAEATMSAGTLAEYYKAYWLQSIVQSAAAESLSNYFEGGLDCEFFLAGLLMDIGRLAMLKTASADYLPVLKRAHDEQSWLHEVEKEMLGIDHAEVSGRLMQKWGLPEVLIKAGQMQHAPLDQLQQMQDSPDFPLAAAVAVAAAMGDYFCATNKGLALQRMQTLATEFLGLSEQQLSELLAKVTARIGDTAELFSINMEELGDPADLMAEANEQLAHLAVKEHVASTRVAAQKKQVEIEKKELESKHVELQQQALHDPLTKVYNRRFLEEMLAKEVSCCCRQATPMGIIFMDIDRFKKLNDTYGHQFGDLVLRRVAAALAETIRNTDTLARYGGEEFVVLVHQPTEKGLLKVAERLRERIEAERITLDDQKVPVTVSVGAAITIPARGDLEAGTRLMAAADEAMYESKQAGRNQVRFRALLSEAERQLVQLVMQRRFSRWLVSRKVFSVPDISKVLLQFTSPTIRIGELAMRQGWLEPHQIEQILQEQGHSGRRFGEVAVKLKMLHERQVVDLLALQQENPFRLAETLKKLGTIEPGRLNGLLKDYLVEHPGCVPLEVMAAHS
jgi:diguanylate cyclase (GGDEF)-like protein